MRVQTVRETRDAIDGPPTEHVGPLQGTERCMPRVADPYASPLEAACPGVSGVAADADLSIETTIS